VKTVAVETGLQPVKDYLQSQGCQVVDMQNGESSTEQAAVMCISGMDENVMGMEDVVNDIPVVCCDGMSPEQVYQRVKTYLQ
jgi:hypothetical protein